MDRKSTGAPDWAAATSISSIQATAADAGPPTGSGRSTRLHRGRADVVQPEVLVEGAGPEHVEVRLVPDLEAPAADLVAPVALDEMRGEVADELTPTIPVLRRRHDGAVVEHGLVRVQGEIAGHEADLDDRPQPERQDPVVDAVDASEVVDRLTVDLAVDTEVVVEDGVGAHGAHAELVVGHPQRLGELVADVAAAGADAVVELGEALRPDHRPPGAVERSADVGCVDVDAGTPPSPSRRGVAWTGSLAGCPWSSTAATAATVYHAASPGRPGRVRQRRMGDRPHPRLADLERRVLAVGRVARGGRGSRRRPPPVPSRA